MIVLLASLVVIHLRLVLGKAVVSLKKMVIVNLPFSVYFGWISIARMANVSVALIAVGWNGFGIEASTWAVIIICFALLLSFGMLVKRKDITFCLWIVWALVGIQSIQS